MKWTGLLPFEVLCGRPPPLIKGIWGDLKEIGNLTLRQQLQTIRPILSKINDWVWESIPASPKTPTYPYRSGDAIWVKEWNISIAKTSLERPFCCYFVYPHSS
jgi:hypothetical protein